ncbi:hypothetical protein BU23DRAFT_601395, partial [Bimuria novae-zelandiae CBS 107.79]
HAIRITQYLIHHHECDGAHDLKVLPVRLRSDPESAVRSTLLLSPHTPLAIDGRATHKQSRLAAAQHHCRSQPLRTQGKYIYTTKKLQTFPLCRLTPRRVVLRAHRIPNGCEVHAARPHTIVTEPTDNKHYCSFTSTPPPHAQPPYNTPSIHAQLNPYLTQEPCFEVSSYCNYTRI